MGGFVRGILANLARTPILGFLSHPPSILASGGPGRDIRPPRVLAFTARGSR